LGALCRDFAFLTLAYLLEDAYHEVNSGNRAAQGKLILPRKIAVPFSIVSSRIQAVPWLDYSRSFNQQNYKKIDPSLPFKLSNLTNLRSFSGLESEDGFVSVHTAIDAYTPELV